MRKKNDPYSPVIKELIESNYNYEYTFYDIDGCGKEELLLGREGSDGMGVTDAYTIQNGAAVRQRSFSHSTLLYKNGIIRLVGSDHGVWGYGYCRFEAGTFKYLAGLSVRGNAYFRIPGGGGDEIPITKEEFDRIQKEYEGGGQVVLDWKPIAAYQ